METERMRIDNLVVAEVLTKKRQWHHLKSGCSETSHGSVVVYILKRKREENWFKTKTIITIVSFPKHQSVSFQHTGRLQGGLAVSCAIGAMGRKQTVSPILAGRVAGHIIVVACDGVWDILTTREVCETVLMYAALSSNRIIRDTAFARNNSDNINCIVC